MAFEELPARVLLAKHAIEVGFECRTATFIDLEIKELDGVENAGTRTAPDPFFEAHPFTVESEPVLAAGVK